MKKKSSKPKRQTKLQKLIQQYTPELEEAQKRVKELRAKGKDTRALRGAQNSKSKSRGKHGRVFAFNDIKTQRQLNREIVRIRTFLSDPSSKIQNLPKRKVPFSSFNEKEKKKFSSETYEAYRRLQERFGGEERFRAIIEANKVSKSKYDSDNIIENIEDDFSKGMEMDEIIAKWENILEEIESSYKSFRNNEE